MHQKDLLDETKEFLRPSERKIRGIKFHEKYSNSVYIISLVLLLGSILHWQLFDYRFTVVFGVLVFITGVFSELALRRFYGFNGRDAVKYYALQLYDNPNQSDFEQLQSWNKNLFDLTTEYYYPWLGELAEEASNQENPAETFSKELPDALRLIERRERKNYFVLLNIDKVEDHNLPAYYENLLQEVNYCYKFGAYTSASMLLRKLTEKLIEDILLSKGLYSELPREPTFQEMVEIFIKEALPEHIPEERANDFEASIDTWIRKKGNKGAHIPEEFTREEVEELMNHAQRVVRLLIVIRSDMEVPENISRPTS